jgi:hypothetical protein
LAGSKGQKYNLRQTQGKLLKRSARLRQYFYLDGKLYRTIKADRANDIIVAFRFEDKTVCTFSMYSIKRQMQQAFTTAEVCVLLNRSKQNILKHLKEGAINPPYKIGVQNQPKQKEFGFFKWSEDDVLALHEHYLTLGSGRPRKDGILFSAPRIPSRLELVAMMKQNSMYYVQDENGNFVPIFDQPDWT